MMNNLLQKKYLLLVLALLFSYGISVGLTKEVFVANSPTIRPDLQNHLVARVASLFVSQQALAQSNSQKTIIFNNNDTIKQQLAERLQKVESVPLKSVAPGVYAKSAGDVQVTEIRMSEVNWKEYTFNVNGREIKIRVPEGQIPPSEDQVAKQYQ